MITLGLCVRLNARISQRQCEINRNGSPYKPARNGQLPQAELKPCFSCTGCSGLESLQSVDPTSVVSPPPVAESVTHIVVIPVRCRKKTENERLPDKLTQQILERTLQLLAVKRLKRR